jgi:hypothetical protein
MRFNPKHTALLLTLALWCLPVEAQVSGQSPTCGEVNGKTAKDLDNVVAFCAKGIPKGAVEGAFAMESLLWVKVTRPMADAMRADRLTAEQLVKTWMTGWKIHSGSRTVTVHVEWRDVEVARGQTTLTRGDQVTFK